jgi:monooxygenase
MHTSPPARRRRGRRADRRRRPVRHRRRLAPAGALPGKRYAILEARDAIGGTWDLFRYPGVRSDSDMYTLGYSFRPWQRRESDRRRARDPRYMRDTARENGIEPPHPLRPPRGRAPGRARTRVLDAWKRNGGRRAAHLRTRFLHMCSGYYSYDAGPTAPLRGRGALRRPHRAAAVLARRPRLQRQARGRDRQRRHRRDAGAGDGATAAHVTMLQRSPTYVVSAPAEYRFGAAPAKRTCRRARLLR